MGNDGAQEREGSHLTVDRGRSAASGLPWTVTLPCSYRPDVEDFSLLTWYSVTVVR